ncbi:MAG: anaerobic ribonucleoside-triphosphate reductase activating protein [Candidatus Bathyarchaeota archaeon]|nr:anaerobic ribonucleoside-triphosphate reductase activating protein [Candidatus Bathyarchaeota archaeon]
MSNPNVRMRIGGITDMSTVDWYGNVSLVLFFAGCNIRCQYCHNSTLISIDSGTEVDMGYLENRIKTGLDPVPQLDAVVFTGGEPLLQPEAVIEAAKIAKKYGLKVMLDTNGIIFNAAEKVLRTGLIDRVALDVKAPLNDEEYCVVTGVQGMEVKISDAIRKTLMLCNELGIEVEARTTVAPGLSDRHDFIERIANEIKNHIAVYYLQQFDNQGEVLSIALKNEEPPKKEHMTSLARTAIEAGVENVYIKTRFDGLERIK